MPGKKWKSIKRPKVYEALRRKGYSKAKAARISNAQARRGGRKRKRRRYISNPGDSSPRPRG